MKNILIVLLVMTFPILLFGFMPAKKVEVNYTSVLQNSNHPEICYFFINKEILESGNYLGIIDSIAQNTKFTTVFLTGHENADFYDPAFMHPYFKRLVEHAHQQKLKVGLQLWNTFAPVAIENTSRVLSKAKSYWIRMAVEAIPQLPRIFAKATLLKEVVG